jgi:mxaJ protein
MTAREMQVPRRVRSIGVIARVTAGVIVAGLLITIVSRADSRSERPENEHNERAERVLRVCADPNNAPLASRGAPSLEGDIAELIGRALGARVEYTWWAQRRGFYRNTLSAGACDVVIGVPAGSDPVRTTAPYYRSSYVFVARKGAGEDRGAGVRSLDDPRLRTLRIGVPLVGDDGANPPPVHALARRGIVDNVVGYNVVGDYTQDAPPAAVLRAVAAGEVDVAIAWGPLAGAFARTSRVPLELSPIAEETDAGLPMTFSIALGLRRADRVLAAELDGALASRRVELDALLDAWRVPRLPLPAAATPPGPAPAHGHGAARGTR